MANQIHKIIVGEKIGYGIDVGLTHYNGETVTDGLNINLPVNVSITNSNPHISWTITYNNNKAYAGKQLLWQNSETGGYINVHYLQGSYIISGGNYP